MINSKDDLKFDVNLVPNNLDPTLLPLPSEQKTWTTYNFIALWIGMCIGIPTYYLASGLLMGGMNLVQAMGTILIANLILLIPLYLNGQAGQKYGIPSPVYWRAAFGFSGSSIPAVLRAIVGGGWFGIQIWIGGSALNVILMKLFPSWEAFSLGIWICFAVFWALNITFLVSGATWIKKLQAIAAPFLVIWMIVLLIWAFTNAKGFGPMLSGGAGFASFGAFMAFFLPSLNANIGYWAAMPLNVPEFTRNSDNDKSYWRGQLIGLPFGMVSLALVGTLVTSASVVIFGEPLWDPILLTGKMDQPFLVIGMMAFLMLATLTTNVAANGYSPSMDIAHISNGKLTFKQAVLVIGALAVLIQPWRLLNDLDLYMNLFLNGCSVFLAPIAGILISHYRLISKQKLDLQSLYTPEGIYSYSGITKLTKGIGIFHYVSFGLIVLIALVGPSAWLHKVTGIGVSVQAVLVLLAGYSVAVGLFLTLHRNKGGVNPIALFTLSVSVLVCYAGLLFDQFRIIYDGSYIIGILLSTGLYYVFMKKAFEGHVILGGE